MKSVYASLFLAGGAVGIVYGLLDVLTPATTIRWQERSTAKAQGSRRSIGLWFQQLIGADRAADPQHDPGVKRSVRLFGLVLLVVSALILAAGLAYGSTGRRPDLDLGPLLNRQT